LFYGIQYRDGFTWHAYNCSAPFLSAFHASAAEIISIFNICLSGNGLNSNSDPAKPPSIEVPALSFDELKEKTDDFGSKALVGEGSYGRVYYAVLENEQHVAVKKLDTSADPEPDNEFLAQVWFVVCPDPDTANNLIILYSTLLLTAIKLFLQIIHFAIMLCILFMLHVEQFPFSLFLFWI